MPAGRQRIDLTGQTFGLLTVLSFKDIKSNTARWFCICKCGNKVIVGGSDLRAGKQKVCTVKCPLRNEYFGFRSKDEKWLWIMWRNMMRRCYIQRDPAYHNYGGRGIQVYKPWHKYEMFKEFVLKQLGVRPEGHEFDRVDNNKNYTPKNVKWSTYSENVTNLRKTKRLRIGSESVSFRSVYNRKERPVSYTIARARFYKLKWKLRLALSIPEGHRWPKGYTEHMRETVH